MIIAAAIYLAGITIAWQIRVAVRYAVNSWVNFQVIRHNNPYAKIRRGDAG